VFPGRLDASPEARNPSWRPQNEFLAKIYSQHFYFIFLVIKNLGYVPDPDSANTLNP
jgi:hypothetical protein